jgi:hypothetical protein
LQADLSERMRFLETAVASSVEDVVEAARLEAVARDVGFATLQRQVHELATETKDQIAQLAATTAAIADAQTELRGLVAQIWGGET